MLRRPARDSWVPPRQVTDTDAPGTASPSQVSSRMARKADPIIYESMARVIAAGLQSDGSLFVPEHQVWTAANFALLRKHFLEQPLEGKQTYIEKLERQLDGASDAAIQLMAELHYVYLLLPDTISAKKKREILHDVLGFMQHPVTVPQDIDTALEHGLIHPGTFYLTRRDAQIAYLVKFGIAWKALDPADVARCLADPWSFKNFSHSVPPNGAYAQRESLVHLAFPEEFEPISSREHKQLIAKRFAHLVSTPTDDVDRQLLQIRSQLKVKHGDAFWFYDKGIEDQWRQAGRAWADFVEWAKRLYAEPTFAERERDYKLAIARRVAEARSASEQALEWRAPLRRAFGAKDQNLVRWQDADHFLKWVTAQAEADLDEDGAEAALHALWSSGDVGQRIDAFLALLPRAAAAGPAARLNIASFLLLGDSPTEYPVFRPTPFERARDLTQTQSPPATASPSERYLAAIDFLDTFIDEAASRALTIQDRLDAQGLVWWITNSPAPTTWSLADVKRFDAWRGGLPPEGTLAELAENLLLDVGFLEGVVRLLEHKRQVVFQGPPGTGKTFVARELALHLAGSPDNVDLVQFHPSYAYEDFVQGYRPNPDGAGFTLRNGPLLRAAQRALDNPTSTHVLVIDELNRANLAKVFGELYYLLEYRKSEISLQYDDAKFRLPENLWLIGKMNTADRSIALVDGALRRRFYFVPFFPSDPPIRGLLDRWLAKHKPELAWVGAVVDRANDLLHDRHAAIGPSHFMRLDLDEEWVSLIWSHAVLPYVEEQLFGEGERLAEFALDALRG